MSQCLVKPHKTHETRRVREPLGAGEVGRGKESLAEGDHSVQRERKIETGLQRDIGKETKM